jgi:FkbM family methyltransferase
MVMKYELYRGIYVRPETWDHGVVAEQRTYEPLQIEDGDVVLDIGANIGAFAKFAFDHKTCYEPDADNFDLLEYNIVHLMKEQSVAWRQTAVCSKLDELQGSVKLFMNEDGTNKALHSTVEVRGRPSTWVEAVSLIDIEGGEYSLELGDLTNDVTKLAIEFHISKPEFRKLAPEANELIERMGFKPVKPFRMTPKGRTTLMIYRR